MAEGNFGGGGSVQWALKVDDDERDDPRKRTKHTNSQRGCLCKGVDKCPNGTHFVIAVKVPDIANRQDFIKWLLSEGGLTVRRGAARFQLPIQDDAKQISVRWK
jgi:hypothetical protein